MVEIKETKPNYEESEHSIWTASIQDNQISNFQYKRYSKERSYKKGQKKDAQCNTFNETEEIGIL